MQPFGRCEAISVALGGGVGDLGDDGHGRQRQGHDQQFHLFPFLCECNAIIGFLPGFTRVNPMHCLHGTMCDVAKPGSDAMAQRSACRLVLWSICQHSIQPARSLINLAMNH